MLAPRGTEAVSERSVVEPARASVLSCKGCLVRSVGGSSVGFWLTSRKLDAYSSCDCSGQFSSLTLSEAPSWTVLSASDEDTSDSAVSLVYERLSLEALQLESSAEGDSRTSRLLAGSLVPKRKHSIS